MERATAAGQVAEPGGGERTQRKLRNYLLDAGLQLRFAGYLVAIAAVVSAFLGWRLWVSYREASRLVALADPGAEEAIALLLAREDRLRMLWLGLGLAFVVMALLCFALVVTHKVAGPALVVGRICREVGEGRLRRPRPLRRGDLLVNLADEVAAMVDALRVRDLAEREALREAMAVLGEGPEGEARAREILGRLDAEKAARLDS
jgi:hypothetical protein